MKAAIFGLGEEGGEARSMCDRDKHSRDREGDGVYLNIKIPPTKKRGRGENEGVEDERIDQIHVLHFILTKPNLKSLPLL